MAMIVGTYTQASRGFSTSIDPEYGTSIFAWASGESNRASLYASFVNVTASENLIDITANVNTGRVHLYLFGHFSGSLETSSFNTFINTISGTVNMDSTVESYSPLMPRYTLSGVSISLADYFESVTWADVLKGNDMLYGGIGNDTLIDYGNGSTFRGNAGNDALVAMANGQNTAVYQGRYSDYTVSTSNQISYAGTHNATGLIVADSNIVRDGTDQLVNIELLEFLDQTVSIAQIAADLDPNAVFRFYNTTTGTHFYTASESEADSVIRNLVDFNYEGVAFDKNTSHSADSLDIFRFYNTATGTHFYTGSVYEKNSILANLPTYTYEGVAYQAHSTESTGTTELYRFYNTHSGTHFYTANEAEKLSVQVNLSGVYNFEGVAYFVDIAS